jgi:hypothetical protein
MADGTTLSQSAPMAPFAVGPATLNRVSIPEVPYDEELMTCDACTRTDAASRLLSVAIVTTPGSPVATINALPLVVSASAVPSVKRIVFRIRY